MNFYDLGDGITIKALEPQHAAELFRVTDAGREYLRLWLPWVDGVLKVEDSAAYIDFARKQRSENLAFHYAIWSGGDIVGGIAIPEMNWTTGVCKIGYWLVEHYQGKGVMTRATLALINHAFNDLGMNRVEIRCAEANRKSRAIPERLGFKHEGTLRQVEKLADGMVDHAVYGMLASEWKQRNQLMHQTHTQLINIHWMYIPSRAYNSCTS